MTNNTKLIVSRIAVFLVAIIMLLNIGIMPAQAESTDEWANTSIYVSWTDTNGNPFELTATPLIQSTSHAYWIQFTSDMPMENIILNIDPDIDHPEYIYTPASGYVIPTVTDANGTLEGTNIPITITDIENNIIDTLYLYLSAMPAPELIPIPQEIIVNYYDTTNQVIISSSSEIIEAFGPLEIFPINIDGYTISDPSSVTVTLNEDNTLSTNVVTFNYSKIATPEPTATPTIEPTATPTLEPTSTPTIEPTATPTLEPTVTPTEEPTQAPNVPIPQTVSILFLDADSNEAIAPQQSITIDTFTSVEIVPPAFENYTLFEDTGSVFVTLDEDNTLSQNTVTFYYTKTVVPEPTAVPTAEPADEPEPQTVTVYYRDVSNDQAIAPDYPITISTFSSVEISPINIDNYTPVEGTANVVVTLNTDNTLSHSNVVFYYNKLTNVPPSVDPIPQAVTVSYHNSIDDTPILADSSVLISNFGSVEIAPVNIENYTLLENTGNVSVTLNADNKLSQTSVTFYYTPNTTPEPPAITETPVSASATINISYINTNSETIADSQTQVITNIGDNTITATPQNLPSGYEPMNGVSSYIVRMDENGNTDKSTVQFTYVQTTPVEVTATVTINYIDTYGNVVAQPTTQEVSNIGQNTITAAPENLQTGYIPKDNITSVTVNMDAQGQLDTNEVTFTYVSSISEEPEGEAVSRYAVVAGGSLNVRFDRTIDSEKVGKLDEGEYIWIIDTVTTDTGYEWGKIRFGSGQLGFVLLKYTNILSQEESDAYEASITGINTNVHVSYLDENSNVLYEYDEHFVRAGSYEVTVNPVDEIIDYTLIGDITQYLIIDNTGISDPASLVFNFERMTEPVVTGNLTINYVNEQGESVANTQIKKLTPAGTYTITPSPDNLQSGLALSGDSSFEVVLANDGTLTPEELNFIYSEALEPTEQPTQVPEETTVLTTAPTQAPEVTVAPTTAATVVPVITTAPTTVVTQAPTNAPTQQPDVTQAPTAAPTSASTQQPVEQYVGYALTNANVAIRQSANLNDDTNIKSMLSRDTLVFLSGQYLVSDNIWSSGQTLNGINGFMLDNNLQHISNELAQPYINEYNASQQTTTPAPTFTPAPTSTLAPYLGYVKTLGDNVPMRNSASSLGAINEMLAQNTVLNVTGMQYLEGKAWCVVQYKGTWGYVRQDQLTPLNQTEINNYLQSLATPTPSPYKITPQPYNPNANSSYGYVTSDKVNFRRTPNGQVIGTLNKYSFGLILGEQTVNNTTWYRINQSGTEGYVHGGYFKVLSLAALEDFLNSPEYYQGLTNSSSSSSSSNSNPGVPSVSNPGSATQGSLSSLEDYNTGTWNNPNLVASVSYEPFNPYTSPSPNPSTSPSVTPEPSNTPTMIPIGTMIPTEYDTIDTQTNSSPFLIIFILVLIALGGTGYYFYAQSIKRKRIAAARRRSSASPQSRTPRPTPPNIQSAGSNATPSDPFKTPTSYGSTYAPRRQPGEKPTRYDGKTPVTRDTSAQNPFARPSTNGNSEMSNTYKPTQKSPIGMPFTPPQNNELDNPFIPQQNSGVNEPIVPQEINGVNKPYAPHQSSDVNTPYVPHQNSDVNTPYAPRQNSDVNKPYTPHQTSDVRKPYTPQQNNDINKPFVQQKSPYTSQDEQKVTPVATNTSNPASIRTSVDTSYTINKQSKVNPDPSRYSQQSDISEPAQRPHNRRRRVERPLNDGENDFDSNDENL